jgi:hypothetical protein
MAGNYNKNYNPEHLIEALDRCGGFVLEARRYIKNKWGYELSSELIERKIISEGMVDWLKDLRAGLIEASMRKIIYRALHSDDLKAQMWLVEKFMHHINWLKPLSTTNTNEIPGELIKDFDRLRGQSAREIECEAVRSIPEEHGEA